MAHNSVLVGPPTMAGVNHASGVRRFNQTTNRSHALIKPSISIISEMKILEGTRSVSSLQQPSIINHRESHPLDMPRQPHRHSSPNTIILTSNNSVRDDEKTAALGQSTSFQRDADSSPRGQINRGFADGSTTAMHSSVNTNVNANTNAPGYQVIREQYWLWSCRCRSWTKRERILLLVVTGLVLIIFGLGAVIGIIAEKRKRLSTVEDWFQW